MGLNEGLDNLVAKVIDPYDRQARLWPALLALLPLIAMMGLLYGPNVSALTNVVMLATSCGGLYLLTNVCRTLGVRLEKRLFSAWGGMPTTQLLRHLDAIIDGVTKVRYHAFLAAKINASFPDRDQELLNPVAADDVYKSAVRWLLEQTRDSKKFGLLLKELTSYGFHRNAQGVKPAGIMIAVVSIGWTLLTGGVIGTSAKYGINVETLKALTMPVIASLATSIVMLTIWVFYFTQSSTKKSAFTYAETLLRTCDVLNGK